MPRSDHKGPASLGHRENPGNAGSQGKPAMTRSPVLLCSGTLASLSCHCNTHLQLSWIPGISRVPSLDDLPPSSWGRDVPPDLALAGRLPPGQLLTHLGMLGKDAPHALYPYPGCQAGPKVAPGQRCACLRTRAQGVCVSQPGTSGGGQVQTLWPVGWKKVIWGPAVEKLSVCD